MITITKKLKKNKFLPMDFVVLTKEEATDQSIDYKHWQVCQPDEWGISDDGYISQCIYRKTYKKGVEMTFPFGRQWIGKNRFLDFKPHWKSRNFNTVSTKSYGELEVNTKRADLAIDAYLAYKVSGESPDLALIGKLYRPDQKYPEIAAKRLLKLKETKRMIKEKLKEILIERNIDEGYVLDTIKDAIEVSKIKEDPANMIRAAKELSIFLDMAPQKQQVTESLEIDMSHQIEDNFEKQQKKLKATKVQNIADGKKNNTKGEA